MGPGGTDRLAPPQRAQPRQIRQLREVVAGGRVMKSGVGRM